MTTRATDAELIEYSLAQVAERIGDPADRIYARLFEAAPELEALFVLDTDGSVRGEMLFKAFEMLADLVGENRYAADFLEIEYRNHLNVGVAPGRFTLFFEAMVDTFRDMLGQDWTPEIEHAWGAVLTRVGGIVERIDADT